MNRISINLKKGECIVVNDPDNLSKEELTERLSSLFSINNVAILMTETTSIILRPSDISSIRVEVPEKETKSIQAEIKSSPPKVEPEAIDIIKDID